MSSYTGIAAFINIAIMAHKDAIVGRPSRNRRNRGGRGLQSGRPGFVLPREKMDGRCHADDDLGPLNCQRAKTLCQHPVLVQNLRGRIRRVLGGKKGQVAGFAGPGWRRKQVSGGRRRSACTESLFPGTQPHPAVCSPCT